MNQRGTVRTKNGGAAVADGLQLPRQQKCRALPTWYSPSTIMSGLLIGAALAVFPLDALCLFVVPLALILMGWTYYRSRSAVFGQLGIIVLVLIAAALTPVKAMDEVLQQPIQLPAAHLSLAELEAATGTESTFRRDQQWYLSWNLDDVDQSQVVIFSGERISMSEFIQTLEAQTPVRHHFVHCGNAYTVLRGNHASKMVAFRKPRS